MIRNTIGTSSSLERVKIDGKCATFRILLWKIVAKNNHYLSTTHFLT